MELEKKTYGIFVKICLLRNQVRIHCNSQSKRDRLEEGPHLSVITLFVGICFLTNAEMKIT